MYVTDYFGTSLFDSCKDVVYSSLNERALKFVGGGANDYQSWLDFLVSLSRKEKREERRKRIGRWGGEE